MCICIGGSSSLVGDGAISLFSLLFPSVFLRHSLHGGVLCSPPALLFKAWHGDGSPAVRGFRRGHCGALPDTVSIHDTVSRYGEH